MLDQINHHCHYHNLLPDYQSAYRENRCCETVLLKLTNDLLWSMERKKDTALMVLDLSAAFDTVEHNVLLTTLQSNSAINVIALEWFRNYLACREIKIWKTYKKEPSFSVPWGSCSGANLFNMYSSTKSKEVDPSLNLIGFVDDHSIMKEFNPYLPAEENKTIDLLINHLARIKTWMNSVRLKMNNSKSELIIFGSTMQTSKCITRGINIEGDSVHRSQLVRNLGVWLDSDLTFKAHVKKCATAMLNLQRIKNIKKYLTKESHAK